MAENEKTAPTVPTAIGTEQPSQMDCTNSITENNEDCNTENYSYRDFLRKMTDPYYIHIMTLSDLYDTVYESKPPIIDGLLYPGVYLFVGAPKVGKSFLMAQLAYHVSTGTELWGYPVNKGEVLYLALEDDYARLQRRLYRMFGSDKNDNLMFATKVDSINGLLEQQLNAFHQEHPNLRLIIIDTLQKVREATPDYSYGNDYQVMSKLKEFADCHGICLLLVHHTRKQKSDDNFESISGTNGLFGGADGAFILYKDKRTSNTATLEISGRDQQEQKLILAKNPDTLYWELQSKETELWKEPPDPFLEAISKFVTADNPDWTGTATELLEKTGADIPVNSITKRLNINASRLYNEHSIVYRSSRTHDRRRIELHYVPRDSS